MNTIFVPVSPNDSTRTVPTGSVFSPEITAPKSEMASSRPTVTKIAAAPPM